MVINCVTQDQQELPLGNWKYISYCINIPRDHCPGLICLDLKLELS